MRSYVMQMDTTEPTDLKKRLAHVETIIGEIESIPYSKRSPEDKLLLHDYLEERKTLKAEIKALEGST